MAIRRPAKIEALPDAAYVNPEPWFIPDCVADLELIDGQCFSQQSAALCDSPGPGIVCQDCALAEIGESWTNLKARTNAGIARAKYERDLGAAQARHDPEFARAQRWAKQQRDRG